MIRKAEKMANTFIELYEVFNQEKIASGMGNVDSKHYWDSIGKFVEFHNIDINKEPYITSDMVTSWTIHMMESMKPYSVNHYLRGIRVFLYWLMKRGCVKEFKVSLVRAQETNVKFIPEEELKVLLKKPDKNASFTDCRTYAIICFLLATGCRASTLINIRISDIDFKGRIITYRHSKNKSIATVPMSNALYKVLNEYLNEWQRDDKEGYLFCNVGEKQLTVDALKHSVGRYCTDRGLPAHYPHSFRHTFARQWVVNGGNAFALQHMLNHSDLTMTRKYVRIFGNDIGMNIEEFSALDRLEDGKSRTQTVKRA